MLNLLTKLDAKLITNSVRYI